MRKGSSARIVSSLVFLWATLVSGIGPGLAQDAAPPSPDEAIAGSIEGPWYGRIQGLSRPERYLEVMAVEPGLRGAFTASVLFGWADGPVSPTPAEIAVTDKNVALELTASTGAHVTLHFDSDGAHGQYRTPGGTQHPIQFVRVEDRPDYDWLGGVWIAKRNGQTRVFDVKRIVAAPDAKILAIGQYGIAEETGRIRQMVATVEGDPANAHIYWRTQNTIAELKRMSAAPALTGSFEVRDHGNRPDAIIFMQSGAGAPAAGRQTIEVGKPFPDLNLVTLDGDQVRPSDYRDKTVLITFFQSWDVWSTDEMKAFRAAKKRFGDRLAILAVNYRALSRDVSPLSNTVGALPPKVDIADVGQTIDIKRVPTIWILDGAGTVVERESYLPEHRLLAVLDKIVK